MRAQKGKPIRQRIVSAATRVKKSLQKHPFTLPAVPTSKKQLRAGASGASAGIRAGLAGAALGAAAGIVGTKLYEKIKSKRGASGAGGRRRRSSVPKIVRKWASRFSRRRKQEEKVIRKVFGSDGSKVIKRRRAAPSFSPGVITAQEVKEALRR